MARSLSPCLYCERVSDGPTEPPDPSAPWQPVHSQRKMRAPALRSSSLARELKPTLAAKPPPSQSNPLPGSVSPQISVHETPGISPSALCRYIRARQMTKFQILSSDSPPGFTVDLPDSRRQYKADAPIATMRMTAVKVPMTGFLIFIESLLARIIRLELADVA